MVMQSGTTVITVGWYDRDLQRGEGMCEFVFFDNCLISPSPGSIELSHQGATIFYADLVDAVLVAV
jgi:hypothetical protein